MPNRQHSDPSDKNNKPTAVRFLQTRRKPAKKGLLIKQHSNILDNRWHSDYTANHCYNHYCKPLFTDWLTLLFPAYV